MVYVDGSSLQTQPLSKSFWSTFWSGTLHFILNTCLHQFHLLFITHAHTSATCFAAVPRLCHLMLVSLLTLLGTYLYLNITHPSFSSLPTEVPPHFLFLQARSHILLHTQLPYNLKFSLFTNCNLPRWRMQLLVINK